MEGFAARGRGHGQTGKRRLRWPYTFKGRTESDKGTNPEELLGAAHAACYAMYLSAKLSGAGHTVNRVHATSAVSLSTDGGLKVIGIHLTVEGSIGGLTRPNSRSSPKKPKPAARFRRRLPRCR